MIHDRFLVKLILKNCGPIQPIHRTMLYLSLPASDSYKDIYKKDVELFSVVPMGKMSLHVSKDTCYRLLQRSIDNKDLEEGETIYYLITSGGFDSDSFLGTHVIRMFASFGKLQEASKVFVGVARPSVYAWSAIVFAYAMLGQSKQALHLYHAMNQAGARPDSHTFVTILKACANEQELKDGMLVHAHIVEHGLESVDYIGSSLIRLYVQFKSMEDAQLVFDRLVKPTVVLWTDMIHGYAQNKYFVEVFVLFEQMQLKGVQPNQITFVCIIKACASSEAITEGMQIHSLIIKAGVELETFVGSSLVDMYAKCGKLHDARKTFERLHKQDVVEWNAMITGEAQHACVQEVLQLHNHMQQHGIEANQITFTGILKACSNTRTLDPGKQVHAHMIGSRIEVDFFISNVLVNLYAGCGDIQNACKVFKQLEKRNAVTWAVLMAGCAEHGHEKMVFHFFEQMKQEGTSPNNATFLSILRACSNVTDLKLVHSFILEDGFESDLAVASNLISRYGECKSLLDSLNVFKHLQEHDVVSWNALIMVYAQLGNLEATFSLFCRMQRERTRPDSVTFNTMISAFAQRGFLSEALQLFQQMQLHDMEPDAKAFCCILEVCSKLAPPQVGQLIHQLVVERGMEVDMCVGEALLNMYLLCEGTDDAQVVFDRLEHGGVGIWNTMISGYMQIGPDVDLSSLIESIKECPTIRHLKKALELYCDMNQEGISPNRATFVYVLKACSRMMAFDHGKRVHAHIVEAGADQDLLICNMLIHFYAEFGSLEDAYQVFSKQQMRNVVTFNTFFAACAQHSNLKLVLDCFCAMQREGVKADGATFLSLFSACSRAGKEEIALFYLQKMREVYGIEPTYTHYTCTVDLIGCRGNLREGEDLLQTMPFRPNVVGLTSLLSHCRKHGSLNIVTRKASMLEMALL